jgi:hypothetical protein
MIDNIYKNAFKEVYDILENTDEELLKKLPNTFINFLKNNMNLNYQTNIQKNLEIDKQNLLKETESILALIFRSYWATDEEKSEFINTNTKLIERKNLQNIMSIDDVFDKRKSINNISIDKNLMVIKEETFFKKFLTKLRNLIKIKLL